MTSMPLQNRVDPFGELFADAARGLFMGNRGGRLHRDDRTLGTRRWASRQWICCRLAFKGRQREVWGAGYTELFFLDEPTALSAGHRPCFECRREAARAFADCWKLAFGLSAPPRATDMDRKLHAERVAGRSKRRHVATIDDLPDGAFVASDDGVFAVRGGSLLRWTPSGYTASEARPRGMPVNALTPPSILGVLAAGYAPQWHPSAQL
jgi:hypothetical protein